ncbi:MAG: PAS domain-containing protein [Sterolibacterium sp.]|nr:PAS domain-containing protein [Sterolibacterium sp.]
MLAPQKLARNQDQLQSAPSLSVEGDCATLILDAMGNILSCGIVAGKLFGGNLADYAGKPISSFISNFILSDTSLSYSARYFAHLCADGGWRRFEAVDVQGLGFPVELNLSLVESKEQGVFLLSVRRVKETD